MKNAQHIEEALEVLRETDGGKAAPEFLETRLLSAFRQQHAPKPVRASAWRLWASVALAGLMVGAAVYRVAIPGGVEAPATTVSSPKPAIPIAPSLSPTLPEPTRQPAVTAVAKPKPRRPIRKAQDPLEVYTAGVPAEAEEFMVIPYAPPITSQDRGEVIRVRLPRQSIRSMGIPVNADRLFERVPADLLVGQDGIPRGIRLVRASESR